MTPDFKKFWKRLAESYSDAMRKKLASSWCIVTREEQQHRLRTITTLCIELERIKAVSTFSAAWGESSIERIIEGDWDAVEDYVSLLSFKGESAELRARYESLWADFVLVTRAACATARRLQSNQGNPPLRS